MLGKTSLFPDSFSTVSEPSVWGSWDFNVRWPQKQEAIFKVSARLLNMWKKQNRKKEKVLELKLPGGTNKFWVGGFYKTTYYAIQLKKRAVTIATPTSNGPYATSEIQSTFLQRCVDPACCGKFYASSNVLNGEDVCSNNQTYLCPQVLVIFIYNKLFSFHGICLQFSFTPLLLLSSLKWANLLFL